MIAEDMPISGKRVFLLVPKRKVKCSEDDTIRVEELQWLNGRFTARFAEQVYRLTSITTNQEAGWFLRLDDETVYRIDKRKLEELALEKLDPVPAPKQMSVDEWPGRNGINTLPMWLTSKSGKSPGTARVGEKRP